MRISDWISDVCSSDLTPLSPGHLPQNGGIVEGVRASPSPCYRTGMRKIGLLGGSFNPAHQGHRRISVAAMEALDLHEIWWLVSPGNPMKSAEDMAPLRSAETTSNSSH